MLLIAAGLLLTFLETAAGGAGFQPDGVFTAQLVLPPQRYAGANLVAVYQRLYERLSALPGIKSRQRRSRPADRRNHACAGHPRK